MKTQLATIALLALTLLSVSAQAKKAESLQDALGKSYVEQDSSLRSYGANDAVARKVEKLQKKVIKIEIGDELGTSRTATRKVEASNRDWIEARDQAVTNQLAQELNEAEKAAYKGTVRAREI